MVAAAVEEGADGREDRFASVVVLGFVHIAYAVLCKETIEGVGAADKEKAAVETGGGGLLLNNIKNGVGVSENEAANEEERAVGVDGAGGGEERF